MPSRPPSPIPEGAATPVTSPSVVTLPPAVTRRIRPVLRSLSRASPEARNAIPHGTSRLSATVPASFGRGGPVGRPLGVGLRPGLGLPLGDAVGLDAGGLDDVDPEVVGSGSPAQPARAPAATPAEISRK